MKCIIGEIIMELLFEILFTFLFEGCFEIINNKDINIVLRKTLLAIMTLFYLSLILIFIYLTVKISNILAKTIFIGAISLILMFFTRLWIRIYKNKVI